MKEDFLFMNLKNNLIKHTALLSALVTFGMVAAPVTANADTLINSHQVKVTSGDTLSKIALEHNTTVNNLISLNQLANPNSLLVGQVLNISSTTTNTSQVQKAYQYTPKVATVQTISYTAPKTNTRSYYSTTTNNDTNTTASTQNGSQTAAKAWIAAHESGGSYSARNGQYVGKYQLSASYLHGDYSAANQEKVANQYVTSRYGSWTNAQQHWETNGWY